MAKLKTWRGDQKLSDSLRIKNHLAILVQLSCSPPSLCVCKLLAWYLCLCRSSHGGTTHRKDKIGIAQGQMLLAPCSASPSSNFLSWRKPLASHSDGSLFRFQSAYSEYHVTVLADISVSYLADKFQNFSGLSQEKLIPYSGHSGGSQSFNIFLPQVIQEPNFFYHALLPQAARPQMLL